MSKPKNAVAIRPVSLLSMEEPLRDAQRLTSTIREMNARRMDCAGLSSDEFELMLEVLFQKQAELLEQTVEIFYAAHKAERARS